MTKYLFIILYGGLVLKGVQSFSQYSYPQKYKDANVSSCRDDETFRELKRFTHYQIDRRIKDCNLQGCDQDQLIEHVLSESGAKWNQTDNKIDNMTSLINQLFIDNAKLETENDALKEKVEMRGQQTDSTFVSLTQMISQLMADHGKLMTEVDGLKKIIESQDKTPAFMAVHSGFSIDYLKNNKIKFDDVRTNVGNCYDKNTGIFNVPVSGLYVFSVFFLSNSVPLELEIMRNDKRIGRGHGAGSIGNQGTGMNTVDEMTNGDTVYVQCPRDLCKLLGAEYTTFTGYLLR